MTKITDGKAVAKILVDGYLNVFQSGHPVFMETMAKQERTIRENFTYLGYIWLKGLSEVSSYDLRNEASKLLADDICRHIRQEPRLHQIGYCGAEEMEVDFRNDEQIALLLANYLSADSKNGYCGFVEYALRTHKTLQQNLTRLFTEWFRKSEEKSPFLETASLIIPRYALQYI